MEWVARFMWTVIIALFVGALIGGLARILLPGKQRMTFTATIGVGFVAALIGGLLADALGLADTDGIDWIKFAIQLGLAVVGVGFYSGWFFKR
ncbi:MAG: GlsB/YeaQ/YmgE family stress response membrane protein [Acidimicrobiia bacterium]|nr:MAG: GlsB/YeaQ/YmgE family stress response membrane protein [Acidimicrobiia bacterium]